MTNLCSFLDEAAGQVSALLARTGLEPGDRVDSLPKGPTGKILRREVAIPEEAR